MSPNKNESSLTSLSQRAKILVAVLLAIVLVVFLTWDSSPSAVTTTTLAIATTPMPTAAPIATAPTGATSQAASELLADIDLDQILSQNPFRRKQNSVNIPPGQEGLPASNGQTKDGAPNLTATHATARPESATREPPAVAVSAIVMGTGKPAALIAGRLYYENDAINDEWQIAEIRQHGLVLRPAQD